MPRYKIMGQRDDRESKAGLPEEMPVQRICKGSERLRQVKSHGRTQQTERRVEHAGRGLECSSNWGPAQQEVRKEIRSQLMQGTDSQDTVLGFYLMGS